MDRIPIEQARDLLLSHIQQKGWELTDITEAYGRISAEDVFAPAAVPSFRRSAMDGYAVRAADTAKADRAAPAELAVSGVLYAGDYGEIQCAPSTAVRVMTGSYIPDGYDAVIMQEDTDYGMEKVRVYKAAAAGRNICPVGEEFHKGDLIVSRGQMIDRIAVFLLASAGVDRVKTVCIPKVAVITTGSELDDPRGALRAGHIYNGLGCAVSYAVRDRGAEPLYVLHCDDDADDIADTIQGISGDVDLVITTGGVSVGEKDLLPQAMEKLRAQVLFHGTFIQPGTPTMGAVYDVPILCLSGNPFAALANLDYYFPYVMARLTGHEGYLTKERTAVLSSEYSKVNRLRRFVRAKYEDGRVYLPAQGHFSSVLGDLKLCNCYIDLDPDTAVKTGDTVRIRMM